jgi:hypothetical protein
MGKQNRDFSGRFSVYNDLMCAGDFSVRELYLVCGMEVNHE